jgi:HK97 family phage major capsid protein
MNKQEYQEKRQNLINEAENLINEGKVEEGNAKMEEIKELDNQWEEITKAQANLNALNNSTKITDITAQSLNVKGAKEVDTVNNETFNKSDEKEIYLTAWAKDMMGQNLTQEEEEVFNKVNADFRNNSQNAFTHTTGNTGVVIPERVVEGIWKEIEDTYPLWDDVAKLSVNGNLTLAKGETSTDAKWYDEETETEDGKEGFGTLNLTGCELARSITISWKLKAMSMDAFIPYIQSRLAEKMGAALGYGVASGKGKPGESAEFKPEPRGIITALKAETDTPQIVEYTDAAPLAYSHFTNAFAKIKAGYLKGAAIYADNKTIWGSIASLLDNNGRPYFVPDVTGGGVGRILGLIVKEDNSIPSGSVLIGNANKGYLANINQAITLDSEDHKKARETDYIGYAIVDGDVVTNKAFALIKKNS